MAKFNKSEWKKIRTRMNAEPVRYGVPPRIYGSAVAGSFNIRKLGAVDKRDKDTWQFLADLCRHFDLLSIQEVLTDISGLEHLVELTGMDFGLVVSDPTGAFPDEPGLDERMAFIYNTRRIRRRGVVTDVTYDRTKVLQILAEHLDEFATALAPVANKEDVKAGDLSKLQMPTFLAFIRTPFGAEFELFGQPGAEVFRFMAVNAHLNFGKSVRDREQEFEALLRWLINKVRDSDPSVSQNLVLLGDLNLNFDNPETDLPRIVAKIKELNSKVGEEVNVLFPFLDAHPNSEQLMAKQSAPFSTNARTPFSTNARMGQTFDQVGVFTRDRRLKTNLSIDKMGINERGPDYGVIDFTNLFSEALLGKPVDELNASERNKFLNRFDDSVSDHMPIWFRFPLPDVPKGEILHDPS